MWLEKFQQERYHKHKFENRIVPKIQTDPSVFSSRAAENLPKKAGVELSMW